MEVHELSLDGTVEALHARVHLWGLGVGVVVGDAVRLHKLPEVPFELRAVVGEDRIDRVREQGLHEREEVRSSFAAVGLRTNGNGCSGIEINGGEDVPPATVTLFFDRIHGNTVSGVGGLKSLWFPVYFLTLLRLCAAGVGDLGGCGTQATHILQETTDRTRFRTVCKGMLLHKGGEEWVELVFP